MQIRSIAVSGRFLKQKTPSVVHAKPSPLLQASGDSLHFSSAAVSAFPDIQELNAAIGKRDYVAFGRLLSGMKDVNEKNEFSSTLLHLAVAGGYTDMVRVFLASKADPNVRNDAGSTPLHLAVVNGHKEIVDILLNANADPALKDDSDKSAFDLAREYDRPEILERLEQSLSKATRIEKTETKPGTAPASAPTAKQTPPRSEMLRMLCITNDLGYNGWELIQHIARFEEKNTGVFRRLLGTGMPQGTLRGLLPVSAANNSVLTAQLKQLESFGLLTLKKQFEDPQRNQWQLTAQGRQMCERNDIVSSVGVTGADLVILLQEDLATMNQEENVLLEKVRHAQREVAQTIEKCTQLESGYQEKLSATVALNDQLQQAPNTFSEKAIKLELRKTLYDTQIQALTLKYETERLRLKQKVSQAHQVYFEQWQQKQATVNLQLQGHLYRMTEPHILQEELHDVLSFLNEFKNKLQQGRAEFNEKVREIEAAAISADAESQSELTAQGLINDQELLLALRKLLSEQQETIAAVRDAVQKS